MPGCPHWRVHTLPLAPSLCAGLTNHALAQLTLQLLPCCRQLVCLRLGPPADVPDGSGWAAGTLEALQQVGMHVGMRVCSMLDACEGSCTKLNPGTRHACIWRGECGATLRCHMHPILFGMPCVAPVHGMQPISFATHARPMFLCFGRRCTQVLTKLPHLEVLWCYGLRPEQQQALQQVGGEGWGAAG